MILPELLAFILFAKLGQHLSVNTDSDGILLFSEVLNHDVLSLFINHVLDSVSDKPRLVSLSQENTFSLFQPSFAMG